MVNAVVNRSPWRGASGRMLVLGGGYSGRRFASAVAATGMPVLISQRHGGHRVFEEGISPVAFASELRPGIEPAALEEVTHVLVTVPPGRDGKDPVLESLGAILAGLPLQWLGYLSTSGVYGDRGGAWVHEGDPPAPGLPRSRARLACEQAWQASGLPLQVFRLPAIYGPGRCPFDGLRAGSSRLIHKPAQVFSRIHVDDITGALLHNLALPSDQRPSVLNVADDRPCPSSETLGYAAHLLDCKLPEVESYAQIQESLSPMARSFWSENRRTSNRRLRVELGYRLRFPSYREGFRASLLEEQALQRGDGCSTSSGQTGAASG
ncbi:SDR family NAD(P)-dependent oxidoreductase [Synechococcus sp. CBW1107]|uniref:SDR family NAD(P)-dependent oxidoreductase n=1 Tax=Synechococcus sp. CBW1107 TaxID=2789857 RepID=UPI0018CD0579|nr:SDR family NAD(P)-dependent oxidoreductase [Synechococcus sp. CBW1107]QPN57886.1 SDR family NAD(P)-dependent oxidoreductase [Synechococcus sp. CBW1107]